MRMVVVRYRYADQQLRAQHRVEHVQRLQGLADQGVVVAAGPRDDGEGAVIVLAADDAEAARAVMDDDPYVRAGAVIDYSTEPFEAVVTSSPVPPGKDSDRSRSIR